MSRHIENIIGRYPISICLAIVMHYVWAGGIWFDPISINATAPHTLMVATNSTTIAALVYFLVASIAIVGLLTARPMLRIVLLLPQQVVLWFSMVGAAHAIFLGMFADGTIRSPTFLLVDQAAAILVGLGHTAAMLLIARDHLRHDN